MQELTRRAVAERAARLLRDGFVLIDLETTGFPTDPGVQVIEVTVLDQTGVVLLDTLVRPQGHIPDGASRVNRIYDADVANSPAFPEVYPQLAGLLNDQIAVAYNYTFEQDVLSAVCRRYALAPFRPRGWWCPMRAYATFTGVQRYFKLTEAVFREKIPVTNAHRAIGDCRMTLALVRKMAEAAGPL